MSSKPVNLDGIAGIDEAGRGPMIGPLVVCGVLVGKSELKKMMRIRIRDSKVLSAKQRNEFALEIKKYAEKIEYSIVSASEIDRLRANRVTLNEIEVRSFVSIAKKLQPAELYMDAADVNAQRFGDAIGERSGLQETGCKIVSEHKADSKFTVVSAASIMAKVKRDNRILKLHKKYGDFGSGYPSDPKTVEFVRGLIFSGEEIPTIVRKSWKSVTKIIAEAESKQTTLDFF
ncbi:MAG: ribonuclease HII [Candidatus Thorarchaeota archaeon]